MMNDFSVAAHEEKAESQFSGFARLEISRGTCYGSPALEIRFDFAADGEKTTAQFSEGFRKKTLSIERATVENLLSEIFEIIEKPEVLADLRHVEIRYHAEIEWRNMNFINRDPAGEFKAFSNEWFVEEIELALGDTENAEIAATYQKILDRKPHRHAIEIYRLTKRFFRKYFNL